MKHTKSHFTFSKKQRNGIFLLLLIIVLIQCFYYFSSFSSYDDFDLKTKELEQFQKEVDSLKLIQQEKNKPKIYPFNPNYITDYKGYTLGMTPQEIDRLHNYRNQNKWVNSASEFQQVTKVSDSLLGKISPYFKFPEWVTNPKPKTSYTYSNIPKTYHQKIDLNVATAKQLQRVNGIGEKLSDRIVKYRNTFVGGFASDVELIDVYGLSPEVIERITNMFTVKTPRVITTYNLNSATRDELVKIPHIDYEIANAIIEQRTLRDGFKSIDELTKVKDFPNQKIEIIQLYLTLD